MLRSDRRERHDLVGKPADEHRFLLVLVILTAANLIFFVAGFARELANRNGLLLDPGSPLGGDFINLWTAGKLLVAAGVGTIYDPAAFEAFQQDFIHANIGARLWAYPPHSLFLVWPFGLVSYLTGFAAWSVFGVGFLAACARRFGFGWREVFVLVLSPAALSCVYYGQTGNFFAGLMLLALAPGTRTDPHSILGAALLTIKPQSGFLLPLIWGFQRRWMLIFATAAVASSVLILSVLVFGMQAWSDYLHLTMPELSKLERHGRGLFMAMIPSLFMSLRLLGMSGDSALAAHGVFALLVLVTLAWRLSRTTDHQVQSALVLVGTCLITPYMHVYDLSLLLAGGLLILRAGRAQSRSRLYLAVVAAFIGWFVPDLALPLAESGFPIIPLLLLIVFFSIREPGQPALSPAAASD